MICSQEGADCVVVILFRLSLLRCNVLLSNCGIAVCAVSFARAMLLLLCQCHFWTN